jgi:hypothetical protein
MSVNRQRLDRKRIEQLLEDSLVPVEPNSSFVSESASSARAW